MRAAKKVNACKNETLDIAGELFISKGYDHTSTTDIINEVGIEDVSLSKEGSMMKYIEMIFQNKK